MTRMRLLPVGLLFSVSLWAQFDIKGKIQAYPLRVVTVKKWRGHEPQVLVEAKTRDDGSFETKALAPYVGRLFLELDNGQTIPMFSDGKDIAFTTNFDKLEDIQYAKSAINQDFLKVIVHEQGASKMQIVSYLLQVYKPSEPFYASLKEEMDRLTTAVIDTSGMSSVLKYNLELDDFLSGMKGKLKKGDTALAKEYRQEISSRFKSDGELLESSGKFHSLQQAYIGLGNLIYGLENNKRVNEDLDKLLSEVGYETDRGQLTLAGFLNIFKTYDMKDNLDYFIKKADKLTCRVLPELKNKVKVYKSVQVGQIAPQIQFDEPAYGKYKKLSQIPSRYKILMFWSVTCPHCQRELPMINQRYEELKNKGGEFIGISLDRDKEQLSAYIKGVKWHNYCDLKGYASPPAQDYGITGTPVFFLLDQNNKILFVANRFEEVMRKLN